MKRFNYFILLSAICVSANAQFGKKKGNSDQGDKLPKGIEVYDTPHSDEKGISGKYFLKYPVQLEATSAMNMPKPFAMSELTIEYRVADYNASIYFVKDEKAKKIRSRTDADLEIKGGSKVGKAYIEKFNSHVFKFRNNFSRGAVVNNQAFCSPFFFQYSKDPEIFIIADLGSEKFFECNSGDGSKYLGPAMNVISKNKEKLADWDSTKIAEVAKEEFLLLLQREKNAMGETFDLPPKRVNDAAREKEYFNLIKPFAVADKPVAWDLDYAYVAKDWEIKHKKDNPKIISHRTALVVAVSKTMPDGMCKYIYCSINQPWDGAKFGASFMAGFNGALIPISCEKAKSFK